MYNKACISIFWFKLNAIVVTYLYLTSKPYLLEIKDNLVAKPLFF